MKNTETDQQYATRKVRELLDAVARLCGCEARLLRLEAAELSRAARQLRPGDDRGAC